MDFVISVEESEEKMFGKRICPRGLLTDWRSKNATLYPSFLIHDDMFQVMAHFFAVSDGIDQMLKCKDQDDDIGLNMFCCVIPNRVTSLYDFNVNFEHSIDDISEWINSKSLKILHRETVQISGNENEKVVESAKDSDDEDDSYHGIFIDDADKRRFHTTVFLVKIVKIYFH